MKLANKNGKINYFFILNSLTVILISIFLFNKFYISRLDFELKYDQIPEKMVKFINKNFQNKLESKKTSVIFIFNKIPRIVDIENINKLYQKHSKNVLFYVLFQQVFKETNPLYFPHIFKSGMRIGSNYQEKNFISNYFVILEEKKVKYVQLPIKAVELNFLIEKYLHPERDYSSYAISGENLKLKIIKKLSHGNIIFFNLTTNNYDSLKKFDAFTEILVITSNCTSCELKKIVSDLKIRQLMNRRNILIIFPVYSNESQLLNIIKKENINIPIYIDLKDQLDLFSTLTGTDYQFIKIEKSELI